MAGLHSLPTPMDFSGYRPPKIPPEKELTELARHYGEDTRGQLKGTKKSGVTPVDPLPPAGPALDFQSWELRKYIEATQKRKLGGFSARELKTMRAFAYFESAKDSNLADPPHVPLHPVFQNWEKSSETGKRHNPAYLLGEGREGYWEMGNPLVAQALAPCLRLASLFIDNCHMWTWWDTLCFGDLEPIRPIKKHLGRILYSVRPRDPHIVHEERERTRQQFSELASSPKLRWGLADGLCDPATGLPPREKTLGWWTGMTYPDPITDDIFIYLDIRGMEPLLRDDLVAAERLLIQWNVAKTAVHELSHAMWRLMERMERRPFEPFFNDEVTAELGHSLINHIFNGRSYGYTSMELDNNENYNSPLVFIHQEPYPSWRDIVGKLPALKIVDSMRMTQTFPVPIEYFERVQQHEFWNYHIQVFGSSSTYLGPLVQGREISNEGRAIEVPLYFDEHMAMTDVGGEGNTIAHGIDFKKRLHRQTVLRALENSMEAEQTQDREQVNLISQPGTTDSMIKTLAKGFNLNPVGWADQFAKFLRDNPAPTVYIKPARFEQILKYFKARYRVLAIDTMDYPVPEHTFFGYISSLQEKEFKISRDELREFLAYANQQSILFNWTSDARGAVWQRSEGWGRVPPELIYKAHKTPQAHRVRMYNHMFHHSHVYTWRRRRELDEELALYFFNFGLPIEEQLTNIEWRALINWCHNIKKYWVRGPRGIIRCILERPLKYEDRGNDPSKGLGMATGIRGEGTSKGGGGSVNPNDPGEDKGTGKVGEATPKVDGDPVIMDDPMKDKGKGKGKAGESPPRDDGDPMDITEG